MCLIINEKEKEKYLRKHRNKHKVVVWKVVLLDFRTPYQCVKIKPGWFKAEPNEPDIHNKSFLFGGAIHVYRTRKLARNWICHQQHGLFKVIRCEAYLKDLIGVDSKTAAFSKIFIPKKELK